MNPQPSQPLCWCLPVLSFSPQEYRPDLVVLICRVQDHQRMVQKCTGLLLLAGKVLPSKEHVRKGSDLY